MTLMYSTTAFNWQAKQSYFVTNPAWSDSQQKVHVVLIIGTSQYWGQYSSGVFDFTLPITAALVDAVTPAQFVIIQKDCSEA